LRFSTAVARGSALVIVAPLHRNAGGRQQEMANYAKAVRHSAGLMRRSLMESNAMRSWRGGFDGGSGIGKFLIMLLLDNSRIVPEASPGTAFDKDVMRVDQSSVRGQSGNSNPGV
jgi:hypothetical protein